MKAEFYLKKGILQRIKDNSPTLVGNIPDTEEEIENKYWELRGERYNDFYDIREEFREGEVETEIPADWSRHYESKSVAAKIDDKWIGWTYWYGGGKYGEPAAIDWIEDAYFLDCKEEEKLVTVRTFEKI